MQFTIIIFCKAERRAEKAGKGKETVCPEVPERPEQRREKAEGERCADRDGEERVEPQLAAADAQSEGEERGGKEQGIERVERVGERAPRAAVEPHGAQRVIEQSKAGAEEKRAGKHGKLRRDVAAHALAPEQAAEQSAGGGGGILVKKRVDVSVHMQLTAVQTELADVQALTRDGEDAGGGGHDDLVFVKALHIVHAGNGQALAPVQLDAVGGGAAVGRVVISHSKTSHTP